MGLKSGRLVVIFVIALAFTITAGYSQASDIGNLRDRAEAGDARSQRELGNSYLIGVGVPKDESQAAIWYRKAAEHGDAEAQFLLAMLYEQGRGVPKDAGQAAVWYQKSAAKGNTFAKQKVSELQQVQQAPASKGIK
ncbi:MAG: tetratricopeptide repeat protein, partial [Candidatus Korobacteraceae bacterium]